MQKIEINIPIFERNMKLHNKKSLRRSYTSVLSHTSEYLSAAPLGATSKFVLETNVDKEYVEALQELLKSKGFTIVGAKNTFHFENVIADYNKNEKLFAANKDKVDAVKAEYEKLAKEQAPYVEIEDEDCKFFFLPYNDDVKTLYDFVAAAKDEILDFAKKNDITIMMRVSAFTNQLDGFFGFNFYDADQKEEEVVVDYAARFTVGVDFNYTPSVYAAALLLSGLGSSKEELASADLSVHLISENIKYNKA